MASLRLFLLTVPLAIAGDTIVNTAMVSEYLCGMKNAGGSQMSRRMEVLNYPRFHHAQILFAPAAQAALIRMLRSLQTGGGTEGFVMKPIKL
jgi:hypothetical protein